MSSGAYTLKLSRTLYNDTFRAQLLDENQQVIGHLRIVPGVPLDRSLVPEDAPSVPAYLLVIVDDADINKDNLIDFEERASYALLKRFSTEAISFQHCQFYYPSPAFIFEQADALTNPVMWKNPFNIFVEGIFLCIFVIYIIYHEYFYFILLQTLSIFVIINIQLFPDNWNYSPK